MLQGVSRVKLPIIGAVAGAAVKIALNLILITNPKINVLGAVLSTIGCYIVASAFDIFFLARVTRAKIDFMGVLLKPLACAAGMGIASYGAYEAILFLCGVKSLSVLLAIIFGALVYFIGMLFIKGIEREDLSSMPMGKRLISAMDKLGL